MKCFSISKITGGARGVLEKNLRFSVAGPQNYLLPYLGTFPAVLRL